MHLAHRKRKIVKRGLSVASALLCLAVLVWPNFITNTTEPKHHHFFIENTATSIRYKGFDSKGQLFILNSSKGKEVLGNEIQLVDPNLFLLQQDGTKIQMSARKGVLNRDQGIILISEQVRTIHSKGYRLNSNKARIKLANDNHAN
jgi:hypothetical protein